MEENRRGRPKRAVGYIRVSTQGQAVDGCGLELQRERILSFAKEHGYVLNRIYEDIISGNDKRSMTDRPDFSAAVQESKQIHGVIIVARIDRVSRNVGKFREFCRVEQIRIISTVPGEAKDVEATLKAVSSAENVRQNIAARTKKSLATRKLEQGSLGNLATLPAANRSSARSRSINSHFKTLEIRNFLSTHPENRSKSVAETAVLLNQADIFSGRDQPWTKHSLRRQLGLAREELKLLDEPDDDIWAPAVPTAVLT